MKRQQAHVTRKNPGEAFPSFHHFPAALTADVKKLPLNLLQELIKRIPRIAFALWCGSTGLSHILTLKPCGLISSLIPPVADHTLGNKRDCSRSILPLLLQGDRSKYLFAENHPFCWQQLFLSPSRQLLGCERAAAA